MSDELENLRSRWRETRSQKDQSYYLRALLQSGLSEQERIGLAAALGHEGAKATGVVIPSLADHYRTRIREVVQKLSHRECVCFSLECASRVLCAWESRFPADSRPREALRVTRAWLLDGASVATLAEVGKAAADAAIQADIRNFERAPNDPDLLAALHAADSASHVALVAEYATKAARDEHVPNRGVDDATSFAASFAVKASRKSDNEKEWQLSLLSRYLLKMTNEDEVT